MKMFERIARALAIADGKDPDAPAWVKYPGGNPSGICWRDQYADKALAALKAMREPSDKMICAALDEYDRLMGQQSRSYTSDWKAMIDAAIKEAEEG